LLRVSESADWLEWSDWVEPILAEPFTVKDGYANVNDKPGSGVEWNEEAVRRLLI
jgi:mandelate racemase